MLWNAHCRVRSRAVGRGDKGVSSNSFRCILCSTVAQHNTTDDETRVHRMKFEKKRIRIQTVDMRARNESLNHCHLLRVQQRKSCQCGEYGSNQLMREEVLSLEQKKKKKKGEKGKTKYRVFILTERRYCEKEFLFHIVKNGCVLGVWKRKKKGTHTLQTHTRTHLKTHTHVEREGGIFFLLLLLPLLLLKKLKRKANVKRGTQCSARFLTHEFHLSSVPARRRPLVDVKIKDTKCVCESVDRTRQGKPGQGKARRRRRPREGRDEKRFWITQHKSSIKKRTSLARHLLSTACNRRRLIARALNKNMCRKTTRPRSSTTRQESSKVLPPFNATKRELYCRRVYTIHYATYCVM